MQQSRSRPSSRRPSSACPPPRRCRVSLVVPVHARVALGEGGTTLCPCPVPSMPACCCRCSRSSDLRASASSCRCTLASHFNPSSAAESTRSPPAPVAAAQPPLCCYLIHGRRCRIGQCALPPRDPSRAGARTRRTRNWRRNSMPYLHHLCLLAAAGASRSSDLRASLCRVCDCSPLPRDPSRAGARTRRTPTLAVLEIPHRSPLHRKVLCAAPTLNFWATKSRRWILVRPAAPVWSVRDSVSTRALRRTPILSSAEMTFWPPGWRQQQESRRRAGRRCLFQTFVKS